MIKHYLNIANGQRYFKKQNIHYTYKKSIICRKYYILIILNLLYYYTS